MKKLMFHAALAALMSAPAFAQTPQAPSAPATKPATTQTPDADRNSDVVIVTARRVEEQVQDVPAAVTGLSSQQIEDAGGIRDIKDLSYLLPGLSFVDTGNINAENNIRGAGSGTARTAGVDSPIAVLHDGASITGGNIGGRTFTRQDLFDIARVEVTRGPQGALYGVNAVGGVMQTISQRPKATPGASIRTTWSPDIERYAVDAIANMPYTDTLRARVGIQLANKNDGFFRNQFNGRAGDVEDYFGYKGALEWLPTGDLSILLIAEGSSELSPSNVIREVGVQNDPAALPADVPPPDIDGPFKYSMNASNVSHRDIVNYNGQVEWRTDFGTLTSTSLYRERTTDFTSDTDRTAPGYATPPQASLLASCATRACTTLFTDHTELTSEELRFAGEFSKSFSYLVGANIQGRQTEFGTILDGATTSAANTAPSPTRNLSQGVKEEELQTGAFASVNWQIFDPLTVSAAIRYNNSFKKTDAFTVLRGPATGPTSCVNVYGDPFNAQVVQPSCLRNENVLKEKFETTAPSASVKYEILDHLRVFASAGVGYRAGGFNANSILDPQIVPTFSPEKSIAYEAGAKFELWDAFFTLTAFENHFDDMLVTITTTFNGVDRNSRFNAGKAKTSGVDFEAFGGTVLPAGWGRIDYNGAVNYLTGKIESGPYAGRTVEGSPDWTYTGTMTYRKRIFNDWRFVGSASYRGQRGGFTSTTGIDNSVEMADIDLWNASVGVENGRYSLLLEARNLMDETYITLRDPLRSVYGDPREIRLTLAISLGSEERRGRTLD
jgi:iron complex outermembrane receptor protein